MLNKNCPGNESLTIALTDLRYFSFPIFSDLEDRFEALEAKNTILKEYNEYRQIVDEIDHMSDLHLDSSFYKRSMKLDKYVKIEEWFDSSLGQLTVIQRLDFKKNHIIQTNAK